MEIANEFSSSFKRVYSGNDPSATRRLKLLFDQKYGNDYDSRLHENITPYLLTWADMLTNVGKLKLNKSTATFVKAELRLD